MEKLTIIKIGGKVIEDREKLTAFVEQFKQIEGPRLLVHGGGVMADQMLRRMGLEPVMRNGRRVTDAETLDTVVMVYGGLVNKGIVALLQSIGINAIGMTGMDGQTIVSEKRPANPIDYGFAGDVKEVNTKAIKTLMINGFVPVIAPITGSLSGQLLNTNADTMAAELAKGLAKDFDVYLIYGFEIDGVLEDINQSESLIHDLNYGLYQSLKETDKIHSGMIPKLDNAFRAGKYAKSVVIGHYGRVFDISENKTELFTKLSN